MPTVTFKAKVEQRRYVDGTPAPAFVKVPKLTHKHCDMSEWRNHPRFGVFANSDMFESILAKATAHVGPKLHLDRVPDGVTVDTSGFLASVTIHVA